jgi:hypothetical protein
MNKRIACMDEAAFAVEIIKSEECLLDNPLRYGNRKSAMTIGLLPGKRDYSPSKNIGDEADMGTVVAYGEEKVI